MKFSIFQTSTPFNPKRRDNRYARQYALQTAPKHLVLKVLLGLIYRRDNEFKKLKFSVNLKFFKEFLVQPVQRRELAVSQNNLKRMTKNANI